MSSSKCARCELTVYPVEGLRCLDKIWHKGCFKCDECNMTLSLKNYKGFGRRPYCNAHCPQAKATTVADTPEIRRLAENTRIQSQAKYHEDFEKSKGKGFTAIADDPETLRIKEASKIISNVAYHGELERKKQMEEKRSLNGPEEQLMLNNNNGRLQNRMQMGGEQAKEDVNYPQHQSNNYAVQEQYLPNQNQHLLQQQHQQQQQQQHQQQQQQQQRHIQQQQQLLKQKQMHQQQQLLKQRQQVQYAQDHDGQQVINRQSLHLEGPTLQQPKKSIQQQQQAYPMGHLNNQKQLIMRQHQQHQMMMQQQQQQPHQKPQYPQQLQSMDPNMPMNRQPPKQAIIPNNHLPQMAGKHQQLVAAQQQMPHHMKYGPMSEAVTHHQQSPNHMMGGAHLLNPAQTGVVPNGQRIPMNPALATPAQAIGHHMMPGYMGGHRVINEALPKQQYAGPHARQMIHPNQMQPIGQYQMHSQQVQQMHHPQPPMPRRVFRAMYDYVANDVDEVSFVENDILVDCVNVDGGWLIGKNARSGHTGMLPANYVTELPGH